jgi:hypothetical protein
LDREKEDEEEKQSEEFCFRFSFGHSRTNRGLFQALGILKSS